MVKHGEMKVAVLKEEVFIHSYLETGGTAHHIGGAPVGSTKLGQKTEGVREGVCLL